ncbi:MAG: dihydrofolate reductase [Phaeodactylibacter sp.]|nr:dihydrofolate reductase [Phaeodactylibacter sp.]MCB9299324.1 dihydrofolate reductase [Lewinellaceae bacterium]
MLRNIFFLLGLSALIASCGGPSTQEPETAVSAVEELDTFNYYPERFADKKILRYKTPSFEALSLQQKKLVYYLVQAGLSGRDIIYDQNYRHNLAIRHAIDKIVGEYQGDRNTEEWKQFLLYAKQVWFANGIHHHYSNDKFVPGFSQAYLEGLMGAVGASLEPEALRAIFDPAFDARKVDQSGGDLVKGSAVNFYDPDITQAEADAFYEKKKTELDSLLSMGLNSKLVRTKSGKLEEAVWKADGMYGPAIREIIGWLEKAVGVAENEPQAEALRLLIEYYKTGSLKTWDDYNVAWVKATEGDIDYINSFIEVYNDPLGFKGNYESIIEITDFEASERMSVVSKNAQYFEDNSPILPEHKKKEVVGITYKVVAVAGESGDASPSTPIGVNLPNADWIRAKYGSKSVSLGNIIEAYDKADGPGMLSEFANDEEEIARAKEYGNVAAKMHTALHEVIGHASGQLEPGIDPSAALVNYASPLEEARADLVALYFIMDPKLVELGLLPSQEAGKTEYDSYIKNGIMLQLRRIEPGKTIQQAHMRNRSMVSHWVLEKGLADGSIVMEKRDGKTFIDIKDYEKLRTHFGELLREVQRIKSQGDFEAGKNLIENYGVQVDPAIHAEVLKRAEALNIPPYGGFINPKLAPVMDESGDITDIKIEYPADFTGQMLEYGRLYSFLK